MVKDRKGAVKGQRAEFSGCRTIKKNMQPANVATQADTAMLGFVQIRAAPGGVEGCVMVNATVPVLVVVTVLPPRSCTATTGWVVDATPPVEAFGEAVKPILAAVPTEIV